MSRLVRLYPAAWRERYEAEFVGTLQERPVSLPGSVDIVHGAIDAHLHPELTGGAPHVWTHRLPGLLATAAGLIWAAYVVRVVLARREDDWGSTIWIAVFFMLFAVLGDYMAAYARKIGLALMVISATIVLSWMLPWSVGDGLLNRTAGVTGYLLVAAGLLALPAIRAGIRAGFRWLLVAGCLLVPITVAQLLLGGFWQTDPRPSLAMLVALLPYGIAWAILGLRMTLRGSVTIHDAPPTEPTPEVAAA